MANVKYYGNLWSAQDAASYLGVTSQTVCAYIRKGLLSAVDLSSGTSKPVWGIKEYDVVDFSQRMKKTTHAGKVCYKPALDKKPVKKEKDDSMVRCFKGKLADRDREIEILKSEVKKLSEELFNVCIRLDELTK